MADRPGALRVLLYLPILSLLVVHVGFAQGFGDRLPYRPTRPPRPHLPLTNPPQRHRYEQQQQQHNSVNTNNVNPYYGDYVSEDWDKENSDSSYQNENSPQEQYKDHNLFGDSRPSNTHRGNEQGFAPDTPTWQSQVQTTPEESEPKCSITDRYINSVPRGGIHDVLITQLHSETAGGCMQKCCELGPKDCPFIWVYAGKCLAISCPPESPELCEPQRLPEDGGQAEQTGYYRIAHPLVHNIKSEFESEATATPVSDDDVIITSPTDGDFPTEDDNVAPTASGVRTDQTGIVGDQPSQFDWDQSDREGATTDHEQTTLTNQYTTNDHEETTVGYEKTTVGHEETTVGHEKTTVGYEETTVGHEGTTVGHEKTTVGHEKTTVGYEETTVGHEGTTVGHEKTTVGYEETTVGHKGTTVGQEETTSTDEQTATDQKETTLEHVLDNQAAKPTNQDSVAAPPTPNEPQEHLESLTIAVSGMTDVVLPVNRVELFASSWPDPPGVVYHWSRVSGPKEGELSGMDDAAVTLSELVPGEYSLRVTARAPNGQFGEKFVSVTVHEPQRENTPPRPVISPSTNATITLPQKTVVFDASQSQDDKGPENLRFYWQLVAGPMGTTGESDEALLTLSNPQPGQYTYKLTITDSDGAVNVSLVHLKVVPEPDYPPLANAGSDQILKFPNSVVVLNGNQSSDDKPGLKYLWRKMSGPNGVDIEGTDTPYLTVSKLSVGVYVFQLTVTDTAGQTDTSQVTVVVHPEKNEPPVAKVRGDHVVRFPETNATLDGSDSEDDYKKGMKYLWTQISGPRDVVLNGTNKSHLSVSGLHVDPAQGSPTIFIFNLTVTDYANLSSSDTAQLEYRKDPKILPHVSAGPDLTITLPQNTAVLNGSATWDDFGITSYQWSRSDTSPAAGIPLLDSDTKPVLILSDLVNGTYSFTLHVTNGQGVSASDTMVLHVLANPHDPYIIQLHLDADISNFTRADLKDLGKYLSLTLNDYTIQFQGVYESHPHTVVEFYAIDTRTNTHMNVSDTWRKLTENGQDYRVLHYHIVHVEMKDCQLSCSGHGKCDKRTKRCHCDVFWMENPFTATTGRQESNCEWSVFYVVLIVIGVLFAIGISFWLTCWCCLRRRNMARTKRRIRYAIHDHNDEGESKRMLTKGQQYIELKERLGYQQSSLMQSESETEEEVLFDSDKKRRSSSPQIKNNKLNTEKYGKNSSLVNTVIPK